MYLKIPLVESNAYPILMFSQDNSKNIFLMKIIILINGISFRVRRFHGI